VTGYDRPDDELTYVADDYGIPRTQSYRLPLPEQLPISATTAALASSLVVCAGACRLIGLSGYSNKAAAQFVQLFDAAGVPADGAVPVVVFAVGIGGGAATGTFSVYYGSAGRWFDRGVVVVNSSTAATKTIGSADTWFDAQYVPQVIQAAAE
jgi:hypothetical protein